jgi:kinesin family protein 5
MAESRVRVAVRVRPANRKEADQPICVIAHQNCIEIPVKNEAKKFFFDHIFNPRSSQEDIFEVLGREVVQNTRDGFNSCLFAYGQTGCFAKGTQIMMANRTYLPVEEITMGDQLMGDDSTKRTVKKLFRGVEQMYRIKADDGSSYVVNEQHYLILKANEKSIGVKFNGDNSYTLRFVNEHFEFDEIETTGELLGKIANQIKFEVEIKVKDFIALDKEVQKTFRLIRRGVEFPRQEGEEENSVYAFGCRLHEELKEGKGSTISDEIFYGTASIRHKFILGVYDKSLSGGLKHGVRSFDFPATKRVIQTIHQLVFLARSVGLDSSCISDDQKITWKISKIKKRKITDPLTYYSKFEIEKKNVDKFYGFMLDGNHRFLGANFHVLRNSGKTHTMTGDLSSEEYRGLIPRICEALFQERSLAREYTVEISYYEIYSEKIKDLISPSNEKIHPVAIGGSVTIPNLSKHLVESSDEITRLVEEGTKNRTVTSTEMNSVSSRSHAILTIFFRQEMRDKAITAKLNLIDLAGSEKLSDSKVTGKAFKQMIAINKSLTQLKTVITELASGSANVRPDFRSSTLTLILRDSLTGNSKTYFVAAIGPALRHIDATTQTLRFAESAKKVTTKVIENTEDIERREQEAKDAEEMESILANKDHAIDSLEMQLKDQAAEVQMAGEMLTKKRHEMKNMELELSSALNDLASCQSKLLDMIPKSEFEQLQSSFDQLQSSFDQLQQKQTSLSEERDKLSTACEESWAQNSSLSEKTADLQVKLDAARSTVDTKQQELLELTREKDAMEEKYHALKTQLKQAKKTNIELESSKTKYEEEKQFLQTEIELLRGKLEDSVKKNKEDCLHLDEFKKRHRLAEEKIKKLVEAQKQQDEELKQTNHDLEASEENLLQLEELKRGLEKDLESLLEEIEKLTREKKSLQEEMRTTTDRLQVEIEMLKAKETLMISENEKMMNELRTSLPEKKIAEKEEELDAAEKKIMDELKSMREKLEEESKQLDAEKERLRKEKIRSDNQIAKTKRELQVLKSNYLRKMQPKETEEHKEGTVNLRLVKKLVEEEILDAGSELSEKMEKLENGSRIMKKKLRDILELRAEMKEDMVRIESNLEDVVDALIAAKKEISEFEEIINQHERGRQLIDSEFLEIERSTNVILADRLGLNLDDLVERRKSRENTVVN